MRAEHELIICLSKPVWKNDEVRICEALLRTRLNWETVLSQLILHGLTSLAFYRLEAYEFKKYIPKDIYIYLEACLSSNKKQQSVYLRGFLELCQALNNNDIEYCTIKGFVVQKLLYPDGTRAFGDIDILINRESYEEVRTILRKLGYICELDIKGAASRAEQLFLLLNTYEFPEFFKEMGLERLSVDFQHSYSFYRQFKYVVDMRSVTANYRTLNINGIGIKYLAMDDFLIHLCTHTYGDSTVVSEIVNKKGFRLRLFADILGYIEKFRSEIDETTFIDKIINTNTILPVYFCLHYVAEIYGINGKIASLLSQLTNHFADESILLRCGLENGLDNSYIWDSILEDKLFDINCADVVQKVYEPLLKRYSKYDERMR